MKSTATDENAAGVDPQACLEDLMKALITLTARTAFEDDDLVAIVAPAKAGRGRAKLLEAYNRCDGTRTQGEIAGSLKLDPGNFSVTVSRWVDAGVMFRVRSGKRIHLLRARGIGKTASREVG